MENHRRSRTRDQRYSHTLEEPTSSTWCLIDRPSGQAPTCLGEYCLDVFLSLFQVVNSSPEPGLWTLRSLTRSTDILIFRPNSSVPDLTMEPRRALWLFLRRFFPFSDIFAELEDVIEARTNLLQRRVLLLQRRLDMLGGFQPDLKPALLGSCVCMRSHFETEWLQRWSAKLKSRPIIHRKLWEFCYIAQALEERGRLVPGCSGLGFGVGQEPLPALFASLGCRIVATDLDPERAKKNGWVDTGQHADSLAVLNAKSICDPAQFISLVTLRYADMNNVPQDLVGFDFVWSCCALEHLGSLDKGAEFIRHAMGCLRPGGVAVHTFELNVSSDSDTLVNGDVVLYREKDIKMIAQGLAADNHLVEELDFSYGYSPEDLYVVEPSQAFFPLLRRERNCTREPHLNLRVGPYVTTSMGLIIRNG